MEISSEINIKLWSDRSDKTIPETPTLLLVVEMLSIRVAEVLWILVSMVMVGAQPNPYIRSINSSVGAWGVNLSKSKLKSPIM